MWTVGTQLLLCNPICVVGYSIVAWRFFKARIEYVYLIPLEYCVQHVFTLNMCVFFARYEEERLVEFFGEQYTNYQARVWSGVPLI